MLGSFLDILTFKAFKPDPLNFNVPLADRFVGSEVVGLAIGERSLRATVASVGSSGKLVDFSESVVRGYVPERLAHEVHSCLEEFGCEHVVLLFRSGSEVTRSGITYRGTYEEQRLALEEEPGKVLGYEPEQDEGNLIVTSPEFDISLLFTYQNLWLKEIIETVESVGVSVCRSQFSMATVVDYLLKYKYDEAFNKKALMIVDSESVLCMHLEGGNWMGLAYRKAVTNPKIIGELLQRVGATSGEVVYINLDESGFPEPLSQIFPNLEPTRLIPDEAPADFFAALHG